MPLFGLFVGFCWGVPVFGFVASGRYFGACGGFSGVALLVWFWGFRLVVLRYIVYD